MWVILFEKFYTKLPTHSIRNLLTSNVIYLARACGSWYH